MKLLVAIACVLAISGQALADWMHPHYSFRCRESEGIEIFGIHKDSTVIISNGTCKNTPLTQHEGIFNISYNCTDEVKGETPTAIEVEISVKDPIFDETTSATTVSANKTLSTTTQVFIGGHNNHKFKIRCLNIPNAGVNKTVAHVFEGGSHILPDNQKEVSSIEMHFKSIEDINSPDISEIYIGDEFFMFLKYTGVSHYEVIPKQCTAYAGTVVPGERGKNVSLWDESKTGCKVHEELLSSINKYQNKTDVIAAKIYGFRFKGSNYITIACEVGVFPKNSQKKICNSTKRKRDVRLRRRGVVETAVQRKNIIGKIRIIDHPSEYKNMASKTGGLFEWIKLSIGIVILSSIFSIFK